MKRYSRTEHKDDDNELLEYLRKHTFEPSWQLYPMSIHESPGLESTAKKTDYRYQFLFRGLDPLLAVSGYLLTSNKKIYVQC
jgi:hypothetical protein